jgi:hypothetical protein
MPLLRMAMSAKNIQLYCAPTADDRATWLPTVQHVALGGCCFVLACNQFTRRRDFSPDFSLVQGDDPGTVISRGGSCIVAPLGQILVGPDFEGETILTAEIDLRGSRAANTTSTWWATTPSPTCSACTSTSSPRRPWWPRQVCPRTYSPRRVEFSSGPSLDDCDLPLKITVGRACAMLGSVAFALS